MIGSAPFVQCHHMEVEQARFESANARCYLAILSIEHDLSQQLDLEAEAIASS